MGLESFKNSIHSSNSSDDNDKKDSKKLRKCIEYNKYLCNKLTDDVLNRQWASESDWNSNRDEYGINVRAENLKRDVGFTLNQIHVKSGAHPAELTGTQWRTECIDASLYWAYEYIGGDFTSNELDKYWWLPSDIQIKNTTGDTVNERRTHLELGHNVRFDLDKDEVKAKIDSLIEQNNIDIIKSQHIDDADVVFSSSLISSRFGDGSFTQGLNNLGYDSSNISSSKSNGSVIKEIRSTLHEKSKYNDNADGYIYTLELTNDKFGKFIYVGSVSYDKSLVSRLREHKLVGCQTSQRVIIDSDVVNTDNLDFDVKIHEVESYYQYEKSVDKFNSRIEALEDKKYKKKISNSDAHMNKVLGGK